MEHDWHFLKVEEMQEIAGWITDKLFFYSSRQK